MPTPRPDDLVALVPHLLGFHPRESIVVVPLDAGEDLPVGRVDIGQGDAERKTGWELLRRPFADAAGARVAVVCLSHDAAVGRAALLYVGARLVTLGCSVPAQVWSNGTDWYDLRSEAWGGHPTETARRLATQTARLGLGPPAHSREQLAASLVGDRTELTPLVPLARDAAGLTTVGAERAWVSRFLSRFQHDGGRLAGATAARLLVAIQDRGTRNVAWADMSVGNAATHIALWTDLTRRAPDQIRAPAAGLLAFACWLAGDGVRGRCALDQVPGGRPDDDLACGVEALLRNGSHPKVWNCLERGSASQPDRTPQPPRLRRPRIHDVSSLAGGSPPAPGR